MSLPTSGKFPVAQVYLPTDGQTGSLGDRHFPGLPRQGLAAAGMAQDRPRWALWRTLAFGGSCALAGRDTTWRRG